MELVPFVLLGLALAALLAAEWPRVEASLNLEERKRHRRRRRGPDLRVVEGGGELGLGDSEAFAASVQRDLSQLPTIDDRD